MRLKIVSDGTTTGTQLLDADTGQQVHGVQAIRWTCDIWDHQLARAEVVLVGLPVEVAGEVQEVTSVGDDTRSHQRPAPQ